jgi:hypothetical protein
VPLFCRNILPPSSEYHSYIDYITVPSSYLYNQSVVVEALAEQFKYSNAQAFGCVKYELMISKDFMRTMKGISPFTLHKKQLYQL